MIKHCWRTYEFSKGSRGGMADTSPGFFAAIPGEATNLSPLLRSSSQVLNFTRPAILCAGGFFTAATHAGEWSCPPSGTTRASELLLPPPPSPCAFMTCTGTILYLLINQSRLCVRAEVELQCNDGCLSPLDRYGPSKTGSGMHPTS